MRRKNSNHVPNSSRIRSYNVIYFNCHCRDLYFFSKEHSTLNEARFFSIVFVNLWKKWFSWGFFFRFFHSRVDTSPHRRSITCTKYMPRQTKLLRTYLQRHPRNYGQSPASPWSAITTTTRAAPSTNETLSTSI